MKTYLKLNKPKRLHTFKRFAHIEVMSGSFFYAVIIIVFYILLFFPIYFSFSFYFDILNKKCAFCLRIYKFFTIFGGYITFYENGIAIHRNRKKVNLIEFSNILSQQKRFSFIKTFELIKANFLIECDASYILPLICLDQSYKIASFLSEKLKKTRLNIWLVEKETLKITVKFRMFFNLFILLEDLVVYLRRNVKSLWRQKIKKSTS